MASRMRHLDIGVLRDIVDRNRNPVRVLSPNMFRFIDDGAFRNYWTQYVDRVWSTYSSKPMRIESM